MPVYNSLSDPYFARVCVTEGIEPPRLLKVLLLHTKPIYHIRSSHRPTSAMKFLSLTPEFWSPAFSSTHFRGSYSCPQFAHLHDIYCRLRLTITEKRFPDFHLLKTRSLALLSWHPHACPIAVSFLDDVCTAALKLRVKQKIHCCRFSVPLVLCKMLSSLALTKCCLVAVCFAQDPCQTLSEVWHVLRQAGLVGRIILGLNSSVPRYAVFPCIPTSKDTKPAFYSWWTRLMKEFACFLIHILPAANDIAVHQQRYIQRKGLQHHHYT